MLPALPEENLLKAYWMNGGPAPVSETDGKIRVALPAGLPDSVANVQVQQIDNPVMEIPTITTQF